MTVTKDEIRDLTGLTSGHLDHNLLDMFISEATTMIQSELGRNICQRFKRDSYQQGLTYRLRYLPIISVDRVFVNDEHDDSVLVEDAADGYTVDLTEGTVTFMDDVLSDGDSIYVEYVPTLIETCIMYQAAIICLQRVHMKANIDARGGDRLESYRTALEYYKTLIKRRPMNKSSTGGYKQPGWRYGI